MAYIYAKSKGHRTFKVAVEDKHRYYNFNEKNIATYKEDQTNGAGFHPIANNFTYYGISDYMKLSPGTDEDQRVGNKVYMKFNDITYGIYMNGDILTTNFPHGTINDLYFRCRVMLVKFDRVMTSTDLANWFEQTFTYFRLINNYPLQSVHWDKKRESTPWTGLFNIIYDKKITMGKSKSIKMKTIHWIINQNVNFDNTYNTITDESINNTYLIFIGPSCLKYDMDGISRDRLNTAATASVNPLTVNVCMKYEYYDV